MVKWKHFDVTIGNCQWDIIELKKIWRTLFKVVGPRKNMLQFGTVRKVCLSCEIGPIKWPCFVYFSITSFFLFLLSIKQVINQQSLFSVFLILLRSWSTPPFLLVSFDIGIHYISCPSTLPPSPINSVSSSSSHMAVDPLYLVLLHSVSVADQLLSLSSISSCSGLAMWNNGWWLGNDGLRYDNNYFQIGT